MKVPGRWGVWPGWSTRTLSPDPAQIRRRPDEAAWVVVEVADADVAGTAYDAPDLVYPVRGLVSWPVTRSEAAAGRSSLPALRVRLP